MGDTWETGYPTDVTWETIPTSWEEAGLNLDEVARYAGASSGPDVEREAATALALVVRHVGSAAVPPAVVKSAVFDVAADLYARRQHHNGVVTFDSPDGVTAMRVNRDPMASAYPILRPYVTPPLA